MWESIDLLVEEVNALEDSLQKSIVRKVQGFVNLIRTLIEIKKEKSPYDFGFTLVSMTGILSIYNEKCNSEDYEEKKEGKRAVDNIEKLLSSIQEYVEETEAAIRAGERDEENKPSIDEWIQDLMITDIDEQEDKEKDEQENDDGKVTLMTVHSAKGLEFSYIYIAGCEERLFPSERAMESPDGLEEERRLFYVALTRAKAEATLSYCEMRFKWGNMEFSSPSRFLQEIDTQYIDCDEDLRRPQRRNTGDSDSDGALSGRMGNFSRGGYGSNYGGNGGYGGGSRGQGAQRNGEGKTAIEELRKRFDYRFQKERNERTAGVKHSPDPRLVAQPAPQRSTEGMRRVSSGPSHGASPLGPCAYEVGNRVEHPKFGVGIVSRIDTMAEDYKLVVDFGQYGEKTLLAKFAKLTKL